MASPAAPLLDLATLSRAGAAVWRATDIAQGELPAVTTGFELLDAQLPGGAMTPCGPAMPETAGN